MKTSTASALENITLYYREGSSDKVYQCAIEQSGDAFVVNFAYGRRGGTLNTGTKTSSPVDYQRAKEVYDRLAVAFDALNKLVKTSRSDLALIQEDDGRLSVRYPIGGSLAKTSIDSPPVAEWPLLPQMKSPASLLDDGFKSAFKQALECSSSDSSRHTLNGACLDVSQKDSQPETGVALVRIRNHGLAEQTRPTPFWMT